MALDVFVESYGNCQRLSKHPEMYRESAKNGTPHRFSGVSGGFTRGFL